MWCKSEHHPLCWMGWYPIPSAEPHLQRTEQHKHMRGNHREETGGRCGDNGNDGEKQVASRQMLAKRGSLCRCELWGLGLGGDLSVALVILDIYLVRCQIFVLQTHPLTNILKDSTISNTITDVKRRFHACYKRAVVQTLNRLFVVLAPGQRAGLLITVMVNISGASKQNLQRLAESLVGFPPAYLDPLIHYAWLQMLLFKL